MINPGASVKLTKVMKNEEEVETRKDASVSDEQPESALVDGLDYYLENGLMVFTPHFLRRRGYCCDNGCRHCPFEKDRNRLP